MLNLRKELSDSDYGILAKLQHFLNHVVVLNLIG